MTLKTIDGTICKIVVIALTKTLVKNMNLTLWRHIKLQGYQTWYRPYLLTDNLWRHIKLQGYQT